MCACDFLLASGNVPPPVLQNESWEGTYLAADLAARGVADVPGYAYAQDAVALYAALEKHATARLRSAYGEGARRDACSGTAALQPSCTLTRSRLRPDTCCCLPWAATLRAATTPAYSLCWPTH